LRPRLRPVEIIVVPDARFGRAVVLRDTEGVTAQVATIPLPLWPIVSRFDGAHAPAQIAEAAARDTGAPVEVSLVERLIGELDEALFLEGVRYRAAREKIERDFAGAAVRPATHAGGAYHADPDKLRDYLERACLAEAKPSVVERAKVRALVAPHIDPWRGKRGYGHAYGALRAGLAPEVDTFVLLGTSHAPMREPFALCRKSFATPLGAVAADEEMIDALAERAKFDVYADVFNHKREHSLEFQAVFVRHLVGDRPVRIVPVLCGLGESQRTGRVPERDARSEGFLTALRALVEARQERTVVIAGADLAHVGPRFGDPEPLDAEQQSELEATDRASLELAEQGDHRQFFAHVQRDLESRRVCGLGPVYTLLRLLPGGCTGTLVHYEQTIDPDEGSIVSHAALTFG